MVEITLPEMGESVTQGSIVEWRKKVGDYVAQGDPIVDVTTDKVDVEVPATASGVITQILAAEGQTVAVGSVLAQIDPAAKGDGAARAATGNGARTAPQPTAPSAPPAPAAPPRPGAAATPRAQRTASSCTSISSE